MAQHIPSYLKPIWQPAQSSGQSRAGVCVCVFVQCYLRSGLIYSANSGLAHVKDQSTRNSETLAGIQSSRNDLYEHHKPEERQIDQNDTMLRYLQSFLSVSEPFKLAVLIVELGIWLVFPHFYNLTKSYWTEPLNRGGHHWTVSAQWRPYAVYTVVYNHCDRGKRKHSWLVFILKQPLGLYNSLYLLWKKPWRAYSRGMPGGVVLLIAMAPYIYVATTGRLQLVTWFSGLDGCIKDPCQLATPCIRLRGLRRQLANRGSHCQPFIDTFMDAHKPVCSATGPRHDNVVLYRRIKCVLCTTYSASKHHEYLHHFE